MEAIINQQNETIERIEKLIRNHKKAPKARITEGYLKARLESLEAHWKTFTQRHDKLIAMNIKDMREEEYFVSETCENLEETFMDAKGEMMDLLTQMTIAKATETVVQASSRTETNEVMASTSIKLPVIKVPTFSGSYHEWTSFRDLFRSLIHENKSLSDVQRLHYLKTSLTGEPERMVRHIQITADNYHQVWDQISNRYDNKRLIVNSYLKTLSEQAPIYLDSNIGDQLRRLLDVTEESLRALDNLGVSVESWDPLIIYNICQRIDADTRKGWEESICSSKEIPTFKQFGIFIEGRIHTLEALSDKRCKDQKGRSFQRGDSTNRTQPRARTAMQVSTQPKCPACEGLHSLYICRKFKELPIFKRNAIVQNSNCCFNCLSTGHRIKDCQSKRSCFKCKGRHHTLIHREPNVQKAEQGCKSNDSTKSNDSEENKGVAHALNSYTLERTSLRRGVLLATALVEVEAYNGRQFTLRAMLDQGSQACFITESVVQHLRLKRRKCTTKVLGLGSKNLGVAHGIVNIKLKSRNETPFTLSIEALVMKAITGNCPSSQLKKEEWKHISTLDLADPTYDQPGKIDLLLGAEAYSLIIEQGLQKGPPGTPMAQKTKLGWILSGEIYENNKQGIQRVSTHLTTRLTTLNMCNQIDINEQLKRFWQLEDIPKSHTYSEEEMECEKHYESTVTRNEEGRFIVRLPFKGPNTPLGNSKEIALKRLNQVIRRLNNDQELRIEYSKFLKEYLDLGHMEKLTTKRGENASYYMPHHAVVKDSSTTTKVRVVFDASCKTTNGMSLNDYLMVGPSLQDSIMDLILRWRTYKFVFTADITKMYRQIRVHHKDADYQKILWINKETNEVEEYRLLTLTYGTACASHAAIKTLLQVALEEEKKFPIGARIVRRDFYVDDVMSGADDIEEVIVMQAQLVALLKSGGFELRKWASNNAVILEQIDPQERESQGQLEMYKHESIKTLGIHWQPSADYFEFKVNLPALKEPMTKRSFLSDASKLYDPLGWLAPCTVTAKILFQRLWLLDLHWDDQLPEEIVVRWLDFRNELCQLEKIKIPRWMHTSRTTEESLQLHGFSDASMDAYAAVVYSRVIEENGDVKVTLIAAKTKVAPIKQISIPKLELCGSLLLTRLLEQIRKNLKVSTNNVFAWTDSAVVLAWLQSHPRRWKTFVANRVGEIQCTLERKQWFHIESQQNPADHASRGLMPNALITCENWWIGPNFLHERLLHLSNQAGEETNDEERTVSCAIITHEQDGYVRVVTLRCQHGTIRRPITKLCPLPISTQPN